MTMVQQIVNPRAGNDYGATDCNKMNEPLIVSAVSADGYKTAVAGYLEPLP